MLHRAGRPGLPVLPGAVATCEGGGPSGEDLPAQGRHAPALPQLLPEEDAARIESIAQTMIAAPERFHLLTIGPLTNIARLVDRHPGIAERWLSITCMAGQLEEGAEYNVKCDAAAARAVFERLSPRVVGIEACRDVLTREEAEAALDASDPASAFLLDCYRLYREQPGWHADPERAPLTLFDAITLLSLVREDLFRLQELRAFVERDGRLRLTDDGAPLRYAASSDWGAIKPIITGLLRGR